MDEEGFTEEGADSLNQSINGRETDSLVSELGLRLTRLFQLNDSTLIPELSLAWDYDFDIDDRAITASLAGAQSTTFSIKGQDVEQHGMITGTGVTFVNKGGFSMSLKYNGEFRKHYQAHGIIGDIRIEF